LAANMDDSETKTPHPAKLADKVGVEY